MALKHALLLGLSCLAVVGSLPSEASAAGTRPLMIVSDVDDTIKRTNILSPTGTVMNGPRSTNAFGAMNTLYNAWTCDPWRASKVEYSRCMAYRALSHPPSRLVTYVSGSPGRLQMFATLFLKNSGFPVGLFIGRNAVDEDETGFLLPARMPFGNYPETFAFKVAAIQGLIKAHPEFDFILVGDNGEKDVAVFDGVTKWAAKAQPQAALHSFIHQVYAHHEGVPPEAGQILFVTAGDLAVELHRRELLSEEALSATVGQTLLELRKNPSRVFPRFLDCTPLVEQNRFPKAPTGVTAVTAARVQTLFDVLKLRCSR